MSTDSTEQESGASPEARTNGRSPLPPAARYEKLLLALLGVGLYVAFIGLRDLWYPDELDIAEVAQAMFLSGDWVTPRRMGDAWVDYPPMLYWVGSISAHLLNGMSAFALRLPNSLAAIATVFLTYAVGRRWFDARSGLWAGLALLTFLSFVYEGNSYRPDVLFGLMITAGIALYAEGAGERPRAMLRIAGFAFFGLAMLAKGPLGLLLPGLVLVLWHGARREWLRIFELAPLSVAALAVYLPWVVAAAQSMGWDGILHELMAQNFGRFQDGSRGHAQPLFYYFGKFWLAFMPWSWLAPPAIWWLVRSQRWREPKTQLLLWWFGTFLLFLSIATTKRQLYMLPAYPALALLLGPWLASVASAGDRSAPSSRPVRIYTLTLAIVFPALAVGLLGLVTGLDSILARSDLNAQELEVAYGLRLPLAVLSVVLLASGMWLYRAWGRDDARAALVRIAAAHVALYVVILGLVLPAFQPTKTYAPQSQWIGEQVGSETHIGMVWLNGMGKHKRGAFGYHTGKMVDLLYDRDEVESFFRRYPASVVLVHEDSVAELIGQDDSWRDRVIRELPTGNNLYLVLRGPPTISRAGDRGRSGG